MGVWVCGLLGVWGWGPSGNVSDIYAGNDGRSSGAGVVGTSQGVAVMSAFEPNPGLIQARIS